MYNLYIDDMIKYCGGKLLYGNKEQILGNICTDSRKINENDVYVAIVGEKFDGNDYYEDAVKKGASCCIISKIIDGISYDKCATILVDDTIECLQKLASYKRNLYNIPVIAVTGSVGKTSTKDIIYSVVSKKYKTCKTMGNYNNHLGVPLTILSLRDDEALVIEMGMNHLGEISLLSKIAKPSISVITNIGTAHIGNLGSRENILKAKMEILDGMIDNKIIINNDNDLLYKMGIDMDNKYDIYTYSIDNDSDYKAVNIRDSVFESKFDIDGIDKDVVVNVGGNAYIYNSLVAYIVGDMLGIDKDRIKEGISEFKLSSNRLEKKVNSKGVVIIDDTYNANYDSMRSSLELLGRVKDKRKIAIIGDMLELGSYTEDLHKNIGDVVTDNKIDVLITVGEYSKYIVDRVIELGFSKDNIYSYDKEEEIDKSLLNKFDKEDIVLIKGSHGMNLINVVNRLMSI